MRWQTRIAAILAGTVGLAAGAAAENRGLSPIIAFLTAAAPSVGAIDTTNVAGAPQGGLWSNQYVFNLNNPVGADGQQRVVLPNYALNDKNINYQINALYDFLSLYSVTRNNGGEAYGWDNLPIANAQSDIIRTALFGDGTKSGDIIKDVRVGGDPNKVIANATANYDLPATAKQNSLESLRSVLTALGVDNKNLDAHFNHFHVDVNPPQRVEINNLLAENGVVADASSAVAPAATSSQKYDAAFSVCQAVVPITHKDFGLVNGIVGPGAVVTEYFVSKGVAFESLMNSPSSTILVVKPNHGEVQQDSNGAYVYYPNEGYLGPDQMTFVVEVMGKKFKVIETVWVANVAPEYGGCPADYKLPPATTGNDKSGALDVIELPVDGSVDMDALAKLHAMVSFSSEFGLVSQAYSENILATTHTELSSWLNLAQLDGTVANMSGITVSVADLPGAAVGQTVGSNITLDTNAAGNGWFIDTTPADNSEFLPTADPNVWIAKQGSAAYGKMDMLSVLLHEYGHALGIEHSANPYDFMGATLLPGERRLPTADEFALMQQLIQQAKGQLAGATSADYAGASSLTPTPLPVGEGNNVPIPLDLPLGGSLLGMAGFLTRRPQYEAAVNPSFTSLDTATAWQTEGSVDIQPADTTTGQSATATMNEVTGSQTRLNQVFMLGDKDRYLTFTLSGTALGYLQGAPQDAFQVALLDASTGNSLLTTTGQTLSDAFLSLQADGTQNAADCVTCTNNADGASPTRYWR